MHNSTCIAYIEIDSWHKQSARRVSYLVEDANLIYLICRVGQWLVDTYRVGHLVLS